MTPVGLHARAALAHIVAVAAGIFDRRAVAFEGDGRGHQPVEEVAVVAHQQDGAVVVVERLLQEVERVGVEVVGRLVEHQQVGGRGQRLGQQQAVALAARQRAHRLARLLVAEQIFAQVGHDVA